MQNAAASENLEIVRSAIQREFIDRCRKNPSYSLRAFARFLEIDQSFLSKLLKGQRAITRELARTVAPKLGMQMSVVSSAGTRAAAGFLPVSDDEIDLLGGWQHFALIELIKTGATDEREMAARLNLHIEEVRDALQRLQRLGFIARNESEPTTEHTQTVAKPRPPTPVRWKLLAPNTTFTNSKESSAARKRYQREILVKATDALDHVPFERRENASLTVAVNAKRLPEFKARLNEIVNELADYFQTDGETGLDEVYQLSVALFPLTQKPNGDET